MWYAPYFSRPWDDLIDYWGTRFPDGTSSLFSSINETSTYLTTAVLDLRTGHAPYLARGISSSTRQQSIDYHHDPRTGPDPYIQRRLIPLICKTTNYPTTPVLDLQIGHAPYLAKGSLHPWDNNWSTTKRTFDYYGTRINKSRQPISRQPADRPST